jgi:uncharacterized protein
MTRAWELAVRGGAVGELQRLLDAGGDIDARDRHGSTSMMIAAAEGRADVVGWLIERGAGLDATAKYGLSALMLAVVRGHVEVARRLAEAGADRSLHGTGTPGFAGKTALDLARERGDAAMIEILV